MGGNKGRTWSWGPEAASNQIDKLIEKRAAEREDANRSAAAWAESVERYNLRCAAERREQWQQFHRDMERLHHSLAAEHGQKADALAGEAWGEGIR